MSIQDKEIRYLTMNTKQQDSRMVDEKNHLRNNNQRKSRKKCIGAKDRGTISRQKEMEYIFQSSEIYWIVNQVKFVVIVPIPCHDSFSVNVSANRGQLFTVLGFLSRKNWTKIALIRDDVIKIYPSVKPRLGGDRFAWFVWRKLLSLCCQFVNFLFELPQWLYKLFRDMEIKKSNPHGFDCPLHKN